MKFWLPSFSYQAILSSADGRGEHVHVAVAVHVRRKHATGLHRRSVEITFWPPKTPLAARGAGDRDLVILHLAVGRRAGGAQIAGRAQPEAGVGRARRPPNSGTSNVDRVVAVDDSARCRRSARPARPSCRRR